MPIISSTSRSHPSPPPISSSSSIRATITSITPTTSKGSRAFRRRISSSENSISTPRNATRARCANHFNSSPNSCSVSRTARYTADAAQRMTYLRNSLARSELYAADYYMKKEAYLAAVNRAKYIIEHYDQTPAVPEALTIMVKAYDKLEMPTLAEDARRVLAINFPERAKADVADKTGEYAPHVTDR